MEAIFNGVIGEQDQIQFSPENRAFAYGDGLFETMVVRRGSCPLLGYHYKRLLAGATILGLEVPFSQEQLGGFLWELSTKNPNRLLRMRLQLWRKSGGLYAPVKRESEFLITCSDFSRPVWTKEKTSFSESVQLSPSSFSHLKTMSALPYVLAGLEMKKRQLDDIILTDTHGNVAEASSANLFWQRNGQWYTPDLKSGCIAGVMRAYLLDQLKEQQITVKEVLWPREKLYETELLLACNVTGVYTIQRLDYRTFESGRERLSQFIQLPEL